MSDSFMKRHLNTTAVLATILSILGIYMMFQGESFAKAFVALLGGGMVVTGINSLISMRLYALGPRNKSALAIKGLVNIAIGVLVVILSLFTENFGTHILLYILGAQLLVSALISVIQAFLLRKGNVSVAPLLSEALFSIVLAILFFAFPTQIGSLLLKLVGVVLLASGIGMFVWSMRVRKLTRQYGASSATTIEGVAEVVGEPSSKEDKS
ncbi:MAG TPA: hypothetical protein GXZ69_01765 [Spirochaetales bacterium]|jgi:uncharacterized membrane protein HdeD (DUF308 family)|nr:hypothetical protein [Spirochaetales bacterium]